MLNEYFYFWYWVVLTEVMNSNFNVMLFLKKLYGNLPIPYNP